MFVPVRSRGRIRFSEGVNSRFAMSCIVDDIVDSELTVFGLASVGPGKI